MSRMNYLDQKLSRIRQQAESVKRVLDRAGTRLPSPGDLDALHEHMRRGELRTVLTACEAIVAECAEQIPTDESGVRAARKKKREARQSKKKAKKKTSKKKTGG